MVRIFGKLGNALAATLAAAVAPTASAVIISAGPGQGATSDWSGVGQVVPPNAGVNQFFGTGALISTRHVLTAAHVVEGLGVNDVRFVFGGVEYVASAIAIPQGYTGGDSYDIAVVTLTQAVTGADVYRFDDGTLVSTEPGQVGYKVGFGVGGDGVNGTSAANVAAYPYGTKRVGRNAIDLITTSPQMVVDGQGNAGTIAGDMLAYDFDNHASGSAGPLGGIALGADEANSTFGDSGAPMFQWSDVLGAYVITGVTVGGTDDWSRFGDIAYDTRVAAYSEWVSAQVPEPGAVALTALATIGALARRRRLTA